MFVNSDFSDLLRIFNARNVKYMVIGGYAVIQYGEPRFTKDLDLWVSTDPENATAVFEALIEFGALLTNLSAEDFAEEGYFYQMGNPPVRVDILMGIPGVEFGKAWERRKIVPFDDIDVTFIAKEDLITAKRAAGRPQDLLDANSLSQSNDA